MVKIKLDRNAKQCALLKAMGSKVKTESLQAQEMFAALIAPIVGQAIDQMATSSLIYDTIRIDPDGDPSIMVDPYDDNNEGLIDIWSQSAPGGLPTNHVTGVEEFRVPMSTLDSAVSMLKRHARGSRVDTVAKALNRLAQELLVKREYQAWTPVMAAIAQARTDNLTHLIDATLGGTFQLDDLNRLITKVKRLNSAWAGGTPANGIRTGVTDLILSPEVMEDVRGFVYQPMHTRAVPNTDESTVLALPDAIRNEIYNNAGATSIFNINLIELLEFGVGEPFMLLFNELYSPGGGDPSFTVGTDELVLGVDMNADAFVRIVESGNSGDPHPVDYEVLVDDQWVSRSEKLGWYTAGKEGHAVTDKKAVCGIIV